MNGGGSQMHNPLKHSSSAKGYKRPTQPISSVRRKKRKSRSSKLALFLTLGAVAVAAVMITRLIDYKDAQDEYAAYAAMVPTTQPYIEDAETPPAPTVYIAVAAAPAPTYSSMLLSASDIFSAPEPLHNGKPFYSEQVAALKKENSEAVAWIEIPGTAVQYPVAQGKDNEYYQTHTFAKKSRSTGSIFLDSWNSKNLSDFNTVIYGHHMKDGSMFAGLMEYRHENFMRNHKYIYVTLENSKKTYKVFAAYECGDSVDFRAFTANTEKERSAFIKRVSNSSIFNTNADATYKDRLLTLVTCTGGERDKYFVVHAILVEEQNYMNN